MLDMRAVLWLENYLLVRTYVDAAQVLFCNSSSTVLCGCTLKFHF